MLGRLLSDRPRLGHAIEREQRRGEFEYAGMNCGSSATHSRSAGLACSN
jgi:hypothetical protein